MGEKYIIRSKAIFDGTGDRPQPGAILVNGKRIEKRLEWEYDKNGEYKDLPLYDYKEKMILPSFIDAHTHVMSGAVMASEYVCSDLGRGKSQKECAEMIGMFAKAHPELKRIRGCGWFVGNWNDAPLPDKRSLDEVVPDRPVYLKCADAHSYWLNSKALEEAGIKPNPDLKNGIVCTFENGELSGLLLEPAACEPAEEKFMEFSTQEKYDIYHNFQKELARNGIGAVSEMFAEDYTEKTAQNDEIWKRLDEEGKLCAHVYNYMRLFGYTDFTKYFAFQKHFDSEHFHIAGVKGFIDGVTETYTGLLLEPYEDKPQTCGENLPLWPREKMQEEIIAANQAGIQVRLHCIADGSVRMALDLYEEAEKVTGKNELRNTIEHIENIHPDDIERFHKLEVIPSMQPYHVTLSQNDKVFRLGEKRCRYEWPIRSILQAGGKIAIGTDYPVVGLDPFQTIYAALTRRDENGEPMCHNLWEVLDLSTILKAYTQGAAYVYHAEKEMGTLEEGKLANMIVLSQNLFEIEPKEILYTKVECNYFEGKTLQLD
ncbi:MAG: amidohydrolase [Lachnospiraceae bacterium]